MNIFGPHSIPQIEPEVEAEDIDKADNGRPSKIDPKRVLIESHNLIKVVADDPSIPAGKVDIGLGMVPPYGQWEPLNYDPKTGEIKEWSQ